MIASRFPVIFIVGPTASGKSEVAVKLARKINAEIISCDSMQAYKKMPLLSGQPCPKSLKQIRHHLIGVLEPARQWDAADFAKRAKKEIAAVRKRGRIPLIVGGSGLYVQALSDGIFKGPGRNAGIREKLYRQAAKFGSAELHRRLKKIDPRAAAKIHRNDLRRIVRALEVFSLTGKPISELQKDISGIFSRYKTLIFGLNFPRPVLYRRIEKRVEAMFKKGAVAEVAALERVRLSRTAAKALGIKEIQGHLNGIYSLTEAKERLKKNTRRFAKRQCTWFKKDRRIRWIRCRAGESAAKIAGRIFKGLKKAGFGGARSTGNN